MQAEVKLLDRDWPKEAGDMADADKGKKSFWEIFAIVVTAIAAILAGLSGVAALITALNGGGKEGAAVQPAQAVPAAQPPSVNDDAAQRAKAEAEAAKAEAEQAKVEAAKAKARAAELEQQLIAAQDAAKDVEWMKAKVRAAELEKELADSATGSSKKLITILNVNQEAAKKFLDENKGKAGVKTTTSGLQYKVIKKGDGLKPTETDTVKVHYRGTLLDGTEFDSSYKHNKPALFRVDKVIEGWFEALQIMNVGSIFELYIPPELAYGDQGAAPVIQPGSLLKFEVELLDIVGE